MFGAGKEIHIRSVAVNDGETFNNGICILGAVEIESPVRFGSITVTVYDTLFRTIFTDKSYRFAGKINITIAKAGIGSIGNYDRITRRTSIDGLLYRIERMIDSSTLQRITYIRIPGARVFGCIIINIICYREIGTCRDCKINGSTARGDAGYGLTYYITRCDRSAVCIGNRTG